MSFKKKTLRIECLDSRLLLSATVAKGPHATHGSSVHRPVYVAPAPASAGPVDQPNATGPQSDQQLTAAASLVKAEPSGYYVLTPAQVPNYQIPQNLLTNPDVKGFVLRQLWGEVNTAPGVYNWRYLDRQIAQCAEYGKQVKITIFGGVNTPTWAADAWFRFRDHQSGQMRNHPVPWNPTMLANYGKMVQALGAKYDPNPTVIEVSVGGPTRHSNEMHLPDETKSLQDYAPAKIVNAWSTMFTHYSQAFKNTVSALHVANPFGKSADINTLVQPTVDNAKRILGTRLALQQNSLNAKTSSTDYAVERILKQQASLGVRTGYEMISASTNQTRFRGSFLTAIQIGKADGGNYFDIYYQDVPNIP